jgi:hypothetical protein
MKPRYAVLITIFLILIICILSLFRYSIHPVSSSNTLITGYKLDRLTGQVFVLYGNKEFPMKQQLPLNEFSDLIPKK